MNLYPTTELEDRLFEHLRKHLEDQGIPATIKPRTSKSPTRSLVVGPGYRSSGHRAIEELGFVEQRDHYLVHPSNMILQGTHPGRYVIVSLQKASAYHCLQTTDDPRVFKCRYYRPAAQVQEEGRAMLKAIQGQVQNLDVRDIWEPTFEGCTLSAQIQVKDFPLPVKLNPEDDWISEIEAVLGVKAGTSITGDQISEALQRSYAMKRHYATEDLSYFWPRGVSGPQSEQGIRIWLEKGGTGTVRLAPNKA